MVLSNKSFFTRLSKTVWKERERKKCICGKEDLEVTSTATKIFSAVQINSDLFTAFLVAAAALVWAKKRV